MSFNEYELRLQAREKEISDFNDLKNYINNYVDTVLKNETEYKNKEIGLVFSNFEKDIKKYNYFIIFIDDTRIIKHKFIDLHQIGIELIKNEYGYNEIKYNNNLSEVV